jgi:hypothetical protein
MLGMHGRRCRQTISMLISSNACCVPAWATGSQQATYILAVKVAICLLMPCRLHQTTV